MEVWTERLMRLFVESRQTYRDVSKATGIPTSAIHRYLTGETPKIPIDRLEKLAAHFNTTTEYLMGWEKTEKLNNTDNLREKLRRNPGMRVLFDAADGATEEQLLKFVKVIRALRNDDE